MASELHVDAIKHSGGTNAMTISTGGAISFPNNPCFTVSSATNQTIPDATATKIIFGNEYKRPQEVQSNHKHWHSSQTEISKSFRKSCFGIANVFFECF